MGKAWCPDCGRLWEDSRTNYSSMSFCPACRGNPDISRDHEVKAEACEAGPERARADYYKTLCDLQRELIEKMHQYIHDQNRPGSINSASQREWSLATQLGFAQQDNKALRELADEYKEIADQYREELRVICNATN